MTRWERFWFHVAEWIERHVAHRKHHRHHHHKHKLKRIELRLRRVAC